MQLTFESLLVHRARLCSPQRTYCRCVPRARHHYPGTGPVTLEVFRHILFVLRLGSAFCLIGILIGNPGTAVVNRGNFDFVML